MPFVVVRITKEGATAEQKAEVMAQITETLKTVLGKNPASTHIVIEEVEMENWGVAGLPVPEYRAKLKAAASPS